MADIYEVLKKLNIPYEKHEHPAVFTVEEAAKYDRGFAAGASKNLFLRNKKGDIHYLVVIPAMKKVDLKALQVTLHESKLSFASPERMMTYLGLTPGSVSPFGIINDKEKAVRVIIDSELLANEKLGFHPNINTATLVVKTEDFKKFLQWTGNDVQFLKV